MVGAIFLFLHRAQRLPLQMLRTFLILTMSGLGDVGGRPTKMLRTLLILTMSGLSGVGGRPTRQPANPADS